MSPKRLLLIPAILLLFYLGIYSWNQRTHILDDVAANTGLEASGAVLKSALSVHDTVRGAWRRYLDLVAVREENETLKRELAEARSQLVMVAEDRAELVRLRRLLTFSPPEDWTRLGARVLAGRLGANAALESIFIGRGYLTGAVPGSPVVSAEGLIGRVLRAGPTSSTVLLLVDPGSRVAVVSQETRVQGILAGTGPHKSLELRFVPHNTAVKEGEILLTSGLDEAFPKGIPVARVISVGSSDLSPFQAVRANLLSDLSRLEEVLLIAWQPGAGAPSAPVRQPVTRLEAAPEPLNQPNPKKQAPAPAGNAR